MRTSAGVMVFRLQSNASDAPEHLDAVDDEHGDAVEVLLGHMGGPFWAAKDDGAWSFPKGEYEPDESAEGAARREFFEELGLAVPEGPLLAMGHVRASGKQITMFAVRGDPGIAAFAPGMFTMEWPPKSGRTASFPEIDAVAWFSLADARLKVVKSQRIFLDHLAELLGIVAY